ncbi:MAG: hypothetical protein JWL79_2947 [Frankiales bacterium]|nr:hypothetical protein [Frankiales bacterium]
MTRRRGRHAGPNSEDPQLPPALRRARWVGRIGNWLTILGLPLFIVGAVTLHRWLAYLGIGAFIIGPGVWGTRLNLERRWFLKETGISLPSGRKVIDKN